MPDERQLDLFRDEQLEDKEPSGKKVRPDVVEWLVRQGRRLRRRRLLWRELLEAEVYEVN